MAEPGIVVEGVWKKFRRGELHDSLRDLVPAIANKLLGRGPKPDMLGKGDFWALRDVGFEVKPSEALGIIGANGAGKSTMLKVLNRVLRPNRGRVAITGRVGALIEIAAGFHPDLTGRENVFLQGAIMGMRTAQIRHKFDEIVEFSGVTGFIDTPVKRYSSGMNARLGFSIAAHLDPDVMLIDEVLAVGDLAFQKKAFERLTSLVRSAVPVVIVSHQLGRIAGLCTSAMLLDRGECRFWGPPTECIARYVSGAEADDADGTQPVRLHSLELVSGDVVKSGSRIQVVISGTVEQATDAANLLVMLTIRSAASGEDLFTTSTAEAGLSLPSSGEFQVLVSLQLNVPPGTYLVESFSADLQRVLARSPTIAFTVEGGRSFHGSVQMNAELAMQGPAPNASLVRLC